MATTTCELCAEEMTVGAARCPHCGERTGPIVARGVASAHRAFAVLGLAVAGIALPLAAVRFSEQSRWAARLEWDGAVPFAVSGALALAVAAAMFARASGWARVIARCGAALTLAFVACGVASLVQQQLAHVPGPYPRSLPVGFGTIICLLAWSPVAAGWLGLVVGMQRVMRREEETPVLAMA